jgi:hypothetical protein
MLNLDQKLYAKMIFQNKDLMKGITSGKLKPKDHLNLINMIVDEAKTPHLKEIAPNSYISTGTAAGTVGRILRALA